MRFGSAGSHVSAVKAVLSDGRLHELRRGERRFKGARLELPTGGVLEVDPADLGLAPEADLLDALAGGQGSLGVVAELTLSLAPKPATVWALVFFFADERPAADFIEAVLTSSPGPLVALDFLDRTSLNLIADLKKTASKLREIPDPPTGSNAAVLAELRAEEPEAAEDAAVLLMNLVETAGGDPDASWALIDEEAEKARIFRHAAPEALGVRLDRLRAAGSPFVKLALDAEDPGATFGESLARLRAELSESSIKAAVFGHAAGNHLHVNLLSETPDEETRARRLIGARLERAAAQGGNLFMEHGVGKIKREFFRNHERAERREALRSLKKAFDPAGLFNPENVWIPPEP
jgi:D-lactate dehydrogenase (cytochrome)